jgi:hypothetical protein
MMGDNQMQRQSIHRCRNWLITPLLTLLAASGAASAQQTAEPALRPDDEGEGTPANVEDMPWIQGQSLDERKRAREIFLEANVLLEDTLFARAAAKYEEALAIWPHPAFSYNLALARIHLGHSIEAYESMRQAVRYGEAPLGEDLYKNAQNFLALLRNQLAELEVVCDEPGATVTLDGKPLFVGPGRRTLMALPGGHLLMATKNGRLPDNEQIVLAPGQRVRFSLAPQLPAYLVTERRWPVWKPWVVVAAGAAVVAAGGAVNWRSSLDFDDFNREAERLCGGAAGCDSAPITAALRDQRSQAERMQMTARAIYIAGGAMLAGGAVLVYLNRERPVDREAEETQRLSLIPVLGPDTAGLSAHIRF